MEVRSDVIINGQGVPVAGASVLVKTWPAGDLASIFDANGVALANPFTSQSGSFAFAATNGKYTVTTSGAGIPAAQSNPFVLYDPADDTSGSTFASEIAANTAAISSNATAIGTKVTATDLAAVGGAAAVGFNPAGGISAANVQAALVELDTEKARKDDLAGTGGAALVGTSDGSTVQAKLNANASAISAKADTATLAAAGGAASIGVTPVGGIASTELQSALGELDAEKARKDDMAVSITQFGASTSKTTAQNKTALQSAITAVNTAGGGYIVVPGGINYGYVRTNLSTHPDFTGCTTSIAVIDYGPGSSYVAPYKDGAQVRSFYFTPSPGHDDGNVEYQRSNYHTAKLMSNDANLAAPGDPSRTADDNRRISIFLENDGYDTWRIGQGIRSGAGLTNEELSDFVIESYATTGDTLPNYAPMIIERKTGNWGFGVGNSTPQASYYFKSVTAGYESMVVEGLATTTYLALRNSNGSVDDIAIKNESGDIAFNISSQGDAVLIKKATRYVGIGGAGNYQLDVAESRASNFVAKVSNTNTTNGQILSLQSNSAPGNGWDALLVEASAGGTVNPIFRLRGDGTGMCDASWTGGGADRAEMFEWLDGNPDGFDGEKREVGSNRAGYPVVLVDSKIRIAAAGEVPIGVVSLTYDSLGNAAPLNWAQKYLSDDLGNPLLEDCQIVEWQESILRELAKEAIPPSVRTYIVDGKPREMPDPGMPAQEARYEVVKHSYYADCIPAGVTTPADAARSATRRKQLNPNYSADAAYVARTARKEWDAVGVIGICRLRKGQPTAPGWLKLRDISDAVEEWFVR